MNFVSWEQRSMKVTPNYTAKTIYAYATGLLTVEYTEQVTGFLVGYTSEHDLEHTWNI